MTAILIFTAKLAITVIAIPLICRMGAIAVRLGNDDYTRRHR